jgi:uncharacterized repeat protein (TIGR03803 family)
MFSLKSYGLDCRNSGLVLTILSLAALSVASTGAARAQSLTTLTNFNNTNGSNPEAGLIADANGNLFGTTNSGGAFGDGTVFEIVKSSSGYSSTPTTLVNFNGSNGANPYAGLIADANGDLFGTTFTGGAFGGGTVFEIVKTSSGYAATPTTLVSFNGANGAELVGGLDGNGNLFGTTAAGGTFGDGTVFEIVKTSSGYASTPTTLVNFNGANGNEPVTGVIADANGNLFGTSFDGGASGDGTVFEIVKTSSGYASTPTILVNFNGANGANPWSSLILDANGNLFGTTGNGGASANYGTVFEIAKTSSGYANTLTTLVNFDGTHGAFPRGSLIADGSGNLFGTTAYGGVGDGTVFEIVKTASGYASTPTTLVIFDGTNGATPVGSLIADANGNLFDATVDGGVSGDGTVFELTGSGFVPLITPFASFQADLAITTRQPYGYALVAAFTTSAANTAINPATEAITVGIANYSLTIPARSFNAIWGSYVYQGTINGVATYALLTPLGGNRYAFAVAGSPANLSATTNPVTVSLRIGANGGTSQVNAARVP